MEENTFLDYNPQYKTENNEWGQVETLDPSSRNVLTQWWNPQQAEAAQFQREDYFVNKENAFNEYMYNKANEYNSASAQMERAKEAGINPNLMAAGIAGMGGNQAMPMQGSRGDTGMNQNAVNPIEQIGNIVSAIQNGVGTAQSLGELFGFGSKNKADIELIKKNAYKAQEEGKFTRRQRKQLEGIGETLIDNAKKEGQELDKKIEHLKELIETQKATTENINADTNLKNAQEGTEYEKQRQMKLESLKLEYEKAFREIFGIELTHSETAMLIEACLNGKGEAIINYLVDTIAGALKGLKNKGKETITEIGKNARNKINEITDNAHKQWQDRKTKRAERKMQQKHKRDMQKWQDLWNNNKALREAYNNDFDAYIRQKYRQFRSQGYSGRWEE